jgi:spermidine synthase / saccharopine dehydrogenase (NADP+, L-glutamate-forming)
VTISGKELMGTAQPYYIPPAFAFVAYPNRDSTPFAEFYNSDEAETIVRGMLRYQGLKKLHGTFMNVGPT